MRDESDEIYRRDGVFLTVAASGAGIECLGCIKDATTEEVGLPVALHFYYESGSVVPDAPEVETDAFAERGELKESRWRCR